MRKGVDLKNTHVVAIQSPDATPGQKVPRIFWVSLFILMACFHRSTFNLPHQEGDEVVYLSLADRMSWTLQNYNTVDVEGVKDFPARMYRESYFLHPPFYPLLLKVFAALGDAIGLGLIANALLHMATSYLIACFVRLLKGGAMAQMIAAATAAFCPVLFAATIKLHIDGWSGFLMLLSGYFLVKANQEGKLLLFLYSGIAYGIALNTKLTTLGTLPGFLVVTIGLHSAACSRRTALLYFWLPALTLAAPHAVNLLISYGTLYPANLLVHDSANVNPNIRSFLQQITARSHLRAYLYTFALSPFTLLVLTPWFWKYAIDAIRNRTLDAIPIVLFFNLALCVTTIHYATERYWALYLPMFYVLVGRLVDRYRERFAEDYYPAVLLIVWTLMICSSFFQANNPANDVIVPSLVVLIPDLVPWYY